MNSLRKRHAADMRFKLYGIVAIAIAFLFLAILLFDIFIKGVSGLQQTQIRLEVQFDKEIIESGSVAKLIRTSLDKRFPQVQTNAEKRALYRLIPDAAKFLLQDKIEANPKLIGTTEKIWLPAHERVDVYIKQNAHDWETKLMPAQLPFVKSLQESGDISLNFNSAFFTYGDSQEPELAGIAGAMIGSLLTILACMVMAIPLAVLAAVYLEEFAPKNRFTDLIEVNVNNLAAVPSIVFGLLGLAIYLNYFNMPRSAPLVGGMTLALMVVPVIIIAARAALKAVPSSIRQAAMGIGASPLQVVMHHTLPLAAPGVMTGIILSFARALGETAPLLMIGMVAFVADIPSGFSDPATVMPVQIFLWSKNNQIGFVEKTAAAILVLLAILILLNLVAVWVRKKYERRW
jgi:phosphate transport system permease protein